MPLGTHHSRGSRISGGSGPGRKGPPLSYGFRRPAPSASQALNMVGTSCSSSWPYWFGGPHGRKDLLGYQNTAGGGFPTSTKNPVMCVEVHRQTLLIPPKALRIRHSQVDCLLRHFHHGDPAAEDRIYNHVEEVLCMNINVCKTSRSY